MRRPLLLDLSVYWWMAICISPSIRGSPAQSLDPSQWPLGHGHVGQQGGRRFNGSQFQHHQQPLTPLAAASVMQSAAMAAASRSQAEMCNDPRCSCSSASSSSSLGASNVSCHCSPQDQVNVFKLKFNFIPWRGVLVMDRLRANGGLKEQLNLFRRPGIQRGQQQTTKNAVERFHWAVCNPRDNKLVHCITAPK